MSLRSPIEYETENFVMPAWMAGIEVHRTRRETSMSPGFQHSMLE